MDEGLTFRIRETRDASGARLKVLGELDIATAPELQDRLVHLRDERVPASLDLSELTFMDSTGLSLLILAVQEAASDGWRLNVLPDLPDQVRQLFDITSTGEMIIGEH